MSPLAPYLYGWTSAHHPEASASLFPKATYLSHFSSQKSSYHVLPNLRIFTKRIPVVFVHTSPVQTKWISETGSFVVSVVVFKDTS